MTNEEIKKDLEQITVHLNEIAKIEQKLYAERERVFSETYKFMATPVIVQCNAADKYKPVILVSDLEEMKDVLGELNTGESLLGDYMKFYTELNGVELQSFKKIEAQNAN